MMKLSCPVCNMPLFPEEGRLVCEKNHSFDRAKSGYVNLLLSNGKHSKLPGDNKLMVNARRDFLQKGYYAPLAKALCEEAVSLYREAETPEWAVLDVGCGEGYYTNAVFESLSDLGNIQVAGIDISKFALNAAAKKNKQVEYAVASAFHLPVADRSVDLLLNLFAPYCGEEFWRVLKRGGLMLMVIPSKRHLWELKQAVYDSPYENEVKGYDLPEFELLKVRKIKDTITLECQQDIQNLFMMTPYFYKTSEENTQRLAALEKLTTKIEFELLIYRKGDCQ